MVKTILLLTLLFPTAVYSSTSVCDELYIVLEQSVKDGYINEQRAEEIHKRCLVASFE